MKLQSPNLKLAALIIASGVLIAVIITLVVFLVFYAPKKEQNSTYTLQGATSSLISTDFMLDSPEPKWKGLEFSPLRKPMKKWDQIQVKNYFSDPEDILAEILENKTEKAIDQLFINIE